MTSGYALLAHRHTVLGDGDDTGNIISNIFSATGQGVSNIVRMKAESDAAAKGGRDSAAALQAVVIADQHAKDALAKMFVSEDAKSQSASADRLAASLALQTEDAAAAGLSIENQKKRADAARVALENATREWQTASASKDASTTKVKEMWVRAAQQVYAKTQNAMMVNAANLPGGIVQQQAQVRQLSQSWLSRPVLGPIPGWGVLAGIAGVVAMVTLLKRS